MEFYVNVAELTRNAQSNENIAVRFNRVYAWNIASFIGGINQEESRKMENDRGS